MGCCVVVIAHETYCSLGLYLQQRLFAGKELAATNPVSACDMGERFWRQNSRISLAAFPKIVLVMHVGPGGCEEVMLLGKLYM